MSQKTKDLPPGAGDSRIVLQPAEPLDWARVFGRSGPVELEIGSGKGLFLLAEAARRPETLFFGIERRTEPLRLCAARAEKRGLENVRAMKADALEVLWGLVPPGSAEAVHVYYPDPWWKARHRKRRVFNPEFITDVARALAAGGKLKVATDVGGYFEEIVAGVAASGLFDPVEAPPGEFGTPENPLTSYQAKYLPLGRAIHGASFVRNAAVAQPTPPPRDRQRLARQRKRGKMTDMGESGLLPGPE